MDGQWYSGLVKGFRGSFGFLTCEEVSARLDGKDVFLHRKDVDRLPCVGDTVRFRLAVSDSGPTAKDAIAIKEVCDNPPAINGPPETIDEFANKEPPRQKATCRGSSDLDAPPSKRCRVSSFLSGDGERVRVALYFGSFDPLHENHFRISVTALSKCHVQRVVLVPNPNGNPFKPDCSPLHLRKTCILERIRAAERVGEISPGQLVVCEAKGATNWPERERIAREVESTLLATITARVEIVFLLGEDSFLKSLQQAAGKHENTGIFQVRRSHRRLYVFPRAGDTECLAERVPERLKEFVEVVAYRDVVVNLSSTRLRALLGGTLDSPPSDQLHPVVWTRLQQEHQKENSGSEGPSGSTRASVSKVLKRPSAVAYVLKKPAASCNADRQVPNQAERKDCSDPRQHYDLLEPQTLDQRIESPSLRIRNFNTYAKAVLLQRFMSVIRARTGSDALPLSVLDLGCGKGGDFRKFANSLVTEYCGVDNSMSSLQEYVRRVVQARAEVARARHGLLGESGFPFREVTLIRADCWRDSLVQAWDTLASHGTRRLRGLEQTWFHLASSQFACHYAFESEASVDMLLRNVSERLCAGGIFVGTIPNAVQIIGSLRWATSSGPRLSNCFCDVNFDPGDWETVTRDMEKWLEPGFQTPQEGVFGVRYRFRLTDAVECCYEPLVHFGTFAHMARRHGLVLEMAPTPLFDMVSEARQDGAAKAELGRLERIYFYKGGLQITRGSPEEEVLRLYVAFAFRKEGHVGLGMNCERLSESLLRVHAESGDPIRMPTVSSDIIDVAR